MATSTKRFPKRCHKFGRKPQAASRRLPIWRDRLTWLGAVELTDGVMARLCVPTALHDICKFSIPFQATGRSRGGTCRRLPDLLGEQDRDVGASDVPSVA